jgi:arylsulfatase A-like enzyme
MFIYLALHNTHAPIEAPERFVAMYNYSNKRKNTFLAMVSVVDESVANVTAALKDTGMWTDTILIWTTDNGSPVNVGGSNDPLRGGKGERMGRSAVIGAVRMAPSAVISAVRRAKCSD